MCFVKMSRIAIPSFSVFYNNLAQADTKADVEKIDTQYDECIRNADGTDSSERNCDAKALLAVNEFLNKIYKKYTEDLKHPGREYVAQYPEILSRLLSSERA